MKVAHVVKRIEMIDDDIKQLRKLETQIKKGKTYSDPIKISIEKQINILLAERIKFLDLKIANPPDFMDYEEEETPRQEAALEPEKASKIKTRKKQTPGQNDSSQAASESQDSGRGSSKTKSTKGKAGAESSKTESAKAGQGEASGGAEESDEEASSGSTMLTQDMIDKKFDEARRRLMEDNSDEKKKGIEKKS